MTSTDTLLPCPFCGGEPVLTEHPPHEHSPILKRVMPDFPDHKGSADVSCLDCAVGHLRDTPTKAIAAWNHRTPPTPAADANPFVGTNWQVRADTPTPVTDEREAVAQWCSGCHEVRSVDCYRAGCPKSDTERRAAEILAAEANERARDALQTLLNMAQPSICYLACEHGSTFEPSNPNIMHSDLCNELRAALTANHSAPVVEG